MQLRARKRSKCSEKSFKPSVLIADGDRELAETTRRFLLLHGLDVETASGGVECLDKLRSLKNRILVLDAELLWGGTVGLLDIMRENSRLAGVPVIITTRNSTEELFSPQVVRYLQKPFSMEMMLNVVESVSEAQEQTDVFNRPEVVLMQAEI